MIKKTLLTLIFTHILRQDFFLTLGPKESCLIENFEQNKEVLISLKVLPKDQSLKFEINAKVTDLYNMNK
jgi:hypothetical protein